MNLDLYKYIYLIGVGGIGMSALARYFNTKGKIVLGYDKTASNLCKELEKEGVNIHYVEQVLDIPDVIKKSSCDDTLVIYTPAISSKNKILSFFVDKGTKVFKRSEILGMISKEAFTIAIAGTHGKTTTATMLAHILQESGKKITAFLGGISSNYNTNLLLNETSDILIVEADEYDRSFLQLYPDIAIITSVDADHLDFYKDERTLHLAFKKFVSQIKKKGVLFVEESISLDFSVANKGLEFKYSVANQTDFFAKNIRVENGRMFFDIEALNILSDIISKRKQKNIELQMPGLHNVSNSVVASAVASYLGVSFSDIAESLATFKGINRRFEKHIDTDKLVYIDDYAHHPQEVSATIDATKQLYPSRQLIVVFQPHLFSRTKDFANEFAMSLEGADDLVLLDIYPAREKPITGVSSKMLLDLCNNTRKEVCSKEKLLSVLENKDIDVLLTLGAGDIGSLAEPIKHMLN